MLAYLSLMTCMDWHYLLKAFQIPWVYKRKEKKKAGEENERKNWKRERQQSNADKIPVLRIKYIIKEKKKERKIK